MRTSLRVLTVVLTLFVAGLVLPQAADANIQPVGVPLFFPLARTDGPGFLCLGVRAGVMTAGTDVIAWTCTIHDEDQGWTLTPSPFSDQFLLKNRKDATKCMSVAAESRAAGAHVIIWDCKSQDATNPTHNADQRWWVNEIRPGSNLTTVQNVNSGLLIGPPGFDPFTRAVVQMNGGANGFNNNIWDPRIWG